MNNTAWGILIFFIVALSFVPVYYRFRKVRRLKREFLEKFKIPVNAPCDRQNVYSKIKAAQEDVVSSFRRVNMEWVEDLSEKEVPFLDFIHRWNEQVIPVEEGLRKLRYLEFLAHYFGFDKKK